MGSQAVSTKHAIGFIGLGRMGLPMASNLYRWLRSQPEHNQQSFTVYNRSISKIQAFLRELSEENTEAVGAESVTLEQLNEVARPLGITVAASPAQVYQQSQLIITSLADDTAVLSIYDQLLPAQDAEREPEATNITRIFVDTSTVSSATTRATVQMIHARSPGARFLACPVFGPPAAARAATIVGVLSGREDAVAIAKHYFLPAICRKLIQTATTIDESLTGGDPAEEEILLALQATKLKLVGNFFLFGVGELIAESMTIADASGISRGHLLELFDTVFPSDVVQRYSYRMANDAFKPDANGSTSHIIFTPRLTLKDIGHTLSLAESHGAKDSAAIGYLLKNNLDQLVDAGHSDDWEWSGIVEVLRQKCTKPTP